MRNRREHPALTPLRDALNAEPTAEELAGEHAALGAFRAASWKPTRRWHRPAVLATKLGVATAAGVLALSGVATAAYTGSLPNSLQDVAHKTIKAPAAHPPAQAVGPDATGSAAYGLCQAFAKDKEDEQKEARKAAERAAEGADERGTPKATPPGQAKKADKAQGPGRGDGQANGMSEERGHGKGSVAYRNLVRAAGGEDKVDAYCATVPKPSDAAGDTDSTKPDAKPTGDVKPTAKPTQAATGKPTDLPAPALSHPTGSPSPHPTGSPEQVPAP